MLTTYHLQGMCCPSEEGMVRRRLEGMAGISRLSFNTLERQLTVEHTAEEAQVRSALDSLGLGARRLEVGSEVQDSPAPGGPSWLQLGMALMLALASEVGALAGWADNSWPVIGLALTAIALGGRETLRKGLLSLRAAAFNMNFLMTVAVIGAMALGEWPEAAMVTVLFGLAEALEGRAVDRARQAIRTLLELAPEEACRLSPQGEEQIIPVGEVEVGQVLRVRPGERIPLDGRVTAGGSSVNQAPITGESLPVEKQVGDAIFAGTLNERGSLDFEVTAQRGHTTLDRIIATVQQAQSERAPTQRFIDRFAAWYTPIMLVLAVATVAVPTLVWQAELSLWVYRALVLLVIACPCALVISTPVSVVSGLTAAARQGILVKGGAYLEQGRHLKFLALDKTGTLTRGRPEVTDLIPLTGRLDPIQILRVAAALESRSEHPIATAVLARHHAETGGAPPSVRDFESLTGRGVRAELEGVAYFLGNHRLVEEQGVCSRELERQLEELEAQGKTAVVLLTRDEAVGILAVADQVRESSRQAVAELRARGLEVVMLTGDNQRTAEAIAQLVGVDRVHAELLPEDKLSLIEQAGRSGQLVGMVGDGINDAPALARADIGFAMGAMGTDTAIETADVALMQDDLRKLPQFLELSRRLGWVLAQNISFSLLVKAVFFALALAGHATLWMAVFADLGASLLVVFNGMRLLKAKS